MTAWGTYLDPRRHVEELSGARRIAVRLLTVLAILTFNFMLMFVFNDALGRVGETPVVEPPGSPQARIGAAHPGEAVHIVGAAAALASA